jgi:hypothetical protein
MESQRPGKTLFSAVTATATSPVFSPGRMGTFSAQFEKTNTGTGDIAFQTNDVDDVTYQADPTLHWAQHDFAAATGVTSGKLDVGSGNPITPIKVKLTGISSRRCRFVFTKASGTVAFYGWLTGL